MNTSDEALCVQLAFHEIAAANSNESVATLVKYLGYKRPLTEGEKLGIFMHGNGPNVLYPAVRELAGIGEKAEPELIKFIAANDNSDSIEAENALYCLHLIHHGNTLKLIRELRQEAEKSQDDEQRQRLQRAGEKSLKFCDQRQQAQCDSALR